VHRQLSDARQAQGPGAVARWKAFQREIEEVQNGAHATFVGKVKSYGRGEMKS
jgi:hypothetical protein